MNFSRIRWSAVVAWGMVPLAVWAGLPSTACVCANGRIKLVCKHLAAGPSADHGSGRPSRHSESHCCDSCCAADEALAEVASDHEADCCGAGSCRWSSTAEHSGIGSKSCCKPVLSVPGVAPEAAKISCDLSPALIAAVDEVGALVRPSFAQDVAEFDTGPPLDRVVVYRSLLI